MLGVRHKVGRRWAAPVAAPLATGALLLTAWTVPLWSDPPEDKGILITAEPQLRAPGPSPYPARFAGFGIDVAVDGAGEGRPVALEMWSDGAWKDEDEGVTDADGHVHLVAAAGAYGRVTTEVDGSRVTQNFDATTSGPPLLVNEEFEGGPLGGGWLDVPQPGDGTNCTMTGEEGTSVAEGQLALTVVEDPRNRCDFADEPLLVNGHVVLRTPIGYGTTAARIKFPEGRSVTAQFWLQPGDPGQRWLMDRKHVGVVVAETRGTGDDPQLGTSLNVTRDDEVTASRELLGDGAPTDGWFHVYAVTWTPTSYTFTVDGEVVREVESSQPAPPLTIGLAVVPGQARLPSGHERRTMYVDWLRVWAP